MQRQVRIHATLTICLLAAGTLGLVTPPARSQTHKRLNNFVSELVSRQHVPVGEEIGFVNPRDGWVFIAVKSREAVSASLSGPKQMRQEPLVFRPYKATSADEAMTYLPAGKYQIRLSSPSPGTADKLIVRTIPELFYNAYRRGSQLQECRPEVDDWAFMERHINPHVNTLVVCGAHRKNAKRPSEDILHDWVHRGKHWVSEIPLAKNAKTVEDAYQYYRQSLGINDPCFSGCLLDEFTTKPALATFDQINIEALKRIADHLGLSGKKLYLYTGSPNTDCDNYRAICRLAVDRGYLMAQEWYFLERPPKNPVWETFGPSWHAANRDKWNVLCPGAADSVLMTPSIWNLPDMSGDVDPQVDGKVMFDWEMNLMAMHPALRKLRGINVWTSSYMDEEMIRWMCRLYRHYCIDGNTRLLSTDPYMLPYLVNPDFERGIEGWDLRMADPGSIRAETFKDYGKIQGRFKSTSKGDHFLVARRSASGPNVIRQTIKSLAPGRLYTFRMYTADYSDLKTGRSKRQIHAVKVSIPGATLIPGKEHHVPYYCRHSKNIAPFNTTEKPCWMNYHWVLFRAESPTATLSVSDWSDAQRPGGDDGQETAFNFFQIEPYFADGI